jgi:hypothetical protein
LKKVCRIYAIPKESLRHLSRRPLVHLTHLINNCIRLSHFAKSWKEAEVITIPKPGKYPKFPQKYFQLAYCPQRAGCLKSYSKDSPKHI